MAEASVPIGEIVRRRREARGLTQAQLGELVGTSQQNIDRIERGVVKHSRALPRIAAELDMTEFVLGTARTAPPGEAASGVTDRPAPNAAIGERVRFPRRMLPVFGQAEGGPGGKFVLNGQRIADALCPPSLEAVRDAYAVYVHGDSMEPRYEAGETVYVNPHRPVRRGNYVVVQLRGEAGDPPFGFIKRFVSMNARELVLEQFNPPEGEDRIMRFPREQVISVHRIVGSSED